MRGLTRDSIVEMKDRKLFWLFVAVTLVAVIAIVAFQGPVKNMKMEDAPPNVRETFGSLANSVIVGWTTSFLSILVFLTVLGTAGLIPSMLSRGRADFYLSKPLSRTRLLLGKLFGIWSVYGAMTVTAGLIVLGLIGALYDMFRPGAMWVLIDALVALFVWLSITGLIGIMTGSYALAVTTTFAVWLVQYGLQFRTALNQFIDNRALEIGLDVMYYVLPKHSQTGELFKNLAIGKPVTDWLPLWSSLLFATALYCAAIWLFRRKDY